MKKSKIILLVVCLLSVVLMVLLCLPREIKGKVVFVYLIFHDSFELSSPALANPRDFYFDLYQKVENDFPREIEVFSRGERLNAGKYYIANKPLIFIDKTVFRVVFEDNVQGTVKTYCSFGRWIVLFLTYLFGISIIISIFSISVNDYKTGMIVSKFYILTFFLYIFGILIICFL